MDPMDPDKLARFKSLIGFDQRPRGTPGAQAAVPWPDPLGAPGVAGGGWALAADTPWWEAPGSAREWVLRRGPETLVVLAFVLGCINAVDLPARQAFVAELVTDKMHSVAGIANSETLIAFKAFSKHDLEAMFSIGL